MLCPIDLDACDRPECCGGICAPSGEPALNPCHECGALTVVRTMGICVACIVPEPESTGGG